MASHAVFAIINLITSNRLSPKIIQELHTLFNEAKWFYNAFLSSDRKLPITAKEVSVFNKEKQQELRPLTLLSSQMKQGLRDRVKDAIHALHVLKTKGFKVGKLRFKGEINSIPLKQHHNSFTLFPKYVKISKIKAKLHLRGYDQITNYYTQNGINPKDAEITTASLIRRASGFYLHVTVAYPKTTKHFPNQKNEAVGLDFGCQTQLTLSNGVEAVKVEYQVPPSKRSRQLHKDISRSKKVNGKKSRTKNQWKLRLALRKEEEHLHNKRKDIGNKILHVVKSSYKYPCFQNDNFQGWSKAHGKKISTTSLGRIKAGLKTFSTACDVNRWFPSTQQCPQCGHKEKQPESVRTYCCKECGFTEDRDVKSCWCIMEEGLKNKEITKGLERTSMEEIASTLDEVLTPLLVKVQYGNLEQAITCEVGNSAIH